MKLNPSAFFKYAAAGALAAGALFMATSANADVNWSIGVGVPGFVSEPAPAYYEPAPAYYQPAPPPVYYRPPPPPRYYAPAPVYYGPAFRDDDRRFRHREWDGERHDNRRDWRHERQEHRHDWHERD